MRGVSVGDVLPDSMMSDFQAKGQGPMTMTLKTTAVVIADSNIPAKVIRAVVKSIGLDSIPDVNRGGIDGGFGDFIYYKDTVAFFKKHRKDIVKMAEQMAEDMGENTVDFVACFNCLGGKDQNARTEYYPSISRCLYGGRLTDEDDVVANALAWFAAEEVCRAFEE